MSKRKATVTLTFTDDTDGGVFVGTSCSVPADETQPDTYAMEVAAWCQALVALINQPDSPAREAVLAHLVTVAVPGDPE